MLIGIVSDSHDRYDMLKQAVSDLTSRKIDHLIHCGDICSPNMLDLLAGEIPATFVFGNGDWDAAGLQQTAAALKINCAQFAADLTFDQKRIAVLHGDHHRRLQQFIESQDFDYIFHGHTHLRRDDTIGKTRIINPGALQRAAVKTWATLDTTTNTLQFLQMSPVT